MLLLINNIKYTAVKWSGKPAADPKVPGKAWMPSCPSLAQLEAALKNW